MPFVVSFVGRSESGKTTLIEKLIVELKGRGYRVGTVKHSHQEVEMDRPGKDSWRMAQAGSEAVALSVPHRLTISRKTEGNASLEQIAFLMGDLDVILAEGFKEDGAPKVEVHRKEQGGGLIFPPRRLFALVSDETVEASVPQYRPGDITGLADLIEEALVSRPVQDEVIVSVNGVPAYLKPYVEEVYSRVLMALTSTLKGAGDMHKVDVLFRRRVREGRETAR